MTPISSFILFLLITSFSNFLKKDLKFIFREGKGEREGEKHQHQYVVAFHTPPTGNLACNPGMCPD